MKYLNNLFTESQINPPTNKTYYKIQAYLGMNAETGKEINVTRQGFASKKDAEMAISRLKVEYSLTDIGWQLQPVISEMWRWGDLYKDSLEQQNNKLT